MRVEQREDSLRHGHKRQILVGALGGVLDGVGEEFKLVHQVWKFRRVDLRELQFPLRQVAQNIFRHGGRDGGGTAVDEFGDFGHAGNLVNAAPVSK